MIPDRVGSMKEGGEGMRLRMRLMRYRWKWASHASGYQISLDELANSLNGYKFAKLW